jgi:tetratricopeptide (TPR) repeat protein
MLILRRVFRLVLRRWADLNNVAKVVGSLSAAIGLATAIITGYGAVTDYFGHRKEAQTAMAAADRQLASGEYRQAWQANAAALKLAPSDKTARQQQITIALRWLENLQPDPNSDHQSFAEAVDPLEQVLVWNESGAQGAVLADLQAHVGWAHFLRSRDGSAPVDVSEEFDHALGADPQNMYGHLYRGFWTVWQHRPLSEARGDLDTAFASAVDPAYSDRIIIAALFSSADDGNRTAPVDYANRIRKAGRDLSGHWTRADILSIYEMGLTDMDFLDQVVAAIPLEEHPALLDWILSGPLNTDRRPNADVVKAYILEREGKTAEAEAAYRQVLTRAPADRYEAGTFAEQSLKRLNPKKAAK